MLAHKAEKKEEEKGYKKRKGKGGERGGGLTARLIPKIRPSLFRSEGRGGRRKKKLIMIPRPSSCSVSVLQ